MALTVKSLDNSSSGRHDRRLLLYMPIERTTRQTPPSLHAHWADDTTDASFFTCTLSGRHDRRLLLYMPTERTTRQTPPSDDTTDASFFTLSGTWSGRHDRLSGRHDRRLLLYMPIERTTRQTPPSLHAHWADDTTDASFFTCPLRGRHDSTLADDTTDASFFTCPLSGRHDRRLLLYMPIERHMERTTRQTPPSLHAHAHWAAHGEDDTTDASFFTCPLSGTWSGRHDRRTWRGRHDRRLLLYMPIERHGADDTTDASFFTCPFTCPLSAAHRAANLNRWKKIKDGDLEDLMVSPCMYG